MDNVYKPPEANLIMENATDTDNNMFYVVSPNKFLLLFIGTLGLYALYWFYRNWSQYNSYENLRVWPVPRAIFAIFFTHSLFRYINEELSYVKPKEVWNHANAATLYVVVTIISNTDRILDKVFGEAISIALVFLSIPLTAWILHGAQIKINQACSAKNGEENSQITGTNIIWLVIGGLIWLISLASIVVILNPDLMELLPAE